MYQDMYDDQIASEISKGRGLGLADRLVQQPRRSGLPGTTQGGSTASGSSGPAGPSSGATGTPGSSAGAGTSGTSSSAAATATGSTASSCPSSAQQLQFAQSLGPRRSRPPDSWASAP